MTTRPTNIWAPAVSFPQEREFYRVVLDDLPTPVLVVDEAGTIVYGNDAMSALVRWTKPEATGTNLMSYIHPDDLAWVSDIFLTLTVIPSAQAVGTSWAPVTVRLVASDGEVVVVEVTGCDRMSNEYVNGMVYHVRLASSQAIERSVVRGLTTGAPADDLLAEIVALVALPPLDLAAAIVAIEPDGTFEVFAASHDDLRDVLCDACLSKGDLGEFNDPDDPQTFAVKNFDGDLAVQLDATGFVTCWQYAIRSDGPVTHRLFAVSGEYHTSDASINERLATATNLAAAVFALS